MQIIKPGHPENIFFQTTCPRCRCKFIFSINETTQNTPSTFTVECPQIGCTNTVFSPEGGFWRYHGEYSEVMAPQPTPKNIIRQPKRTRPPKQNKMFQ